jgi:hypothetical protein
MAALRAKTIHINTNIKVSHEKEYRTSLTASVKPIIAKGSAKRVWANLTRER